MVQLGVACSSSCNGVSGATLRGAFLQHLHTHIHNTAHLVNKNGQLVYEKWYLSELQAFYVSGIIQSVNQDLEGILSNAIYPQLQILASSVDKVVCNIKKNMSKYYVSNENGQSVMWEMPGLYQRYIKMKNMYNGAMVSVFVKI